MARSGSSRATGGLLGAIALGCIAAVGAALVSQHMFDMQPCPWCVLQRVIFLAIALACGAGWVFSRTAALRQVATVLALLLAGCGVAAALWQHFKAAASASCNLTLADKIVSGFLKLDSFAPDVFAVRANCADAAVNLLGVPYDFWSLGLFVLIFALLVRALTQRV